MQLTNGFVQLVQQSQALRSDARPHHAPVARLAGAGNQAPRFHAIEQARDVRIARDEPAADFAAGQALLAGAAQDAQDVVLGAAEAVGLEQGLGAASQGVGGAEQGNKDLGFEGGVRFAFRLSFREATILVITTIVKRNVAGAFFRALRALCVKGFRGRRRTSKSPTTMNAEDTEKTEVRACAW